MVETQQKDGAFPVAGAGANLVEKIVAAAEAAIRNEAAVLMGVSRLLAVVNLEIELRNGGDVVDYRYWAEHRGTIRRKA